MKSQTKTLAEIISGKTYFDLDEIANIIEVHFRIWQSNELNKELNTNNIIKRRNYLLSQKSQIEMQRNAIEKQLFNAKSRSNRGEYFDRESIAKLNFMLQTKKNQLTAIQNDLVNLKSLEKAKNIQESNVVERKINNKVFELIKKEKGEKFAKHIFTEAEKLVVK